MVVLKVVVLCATVFLGANTLSLQKFSSEDTKLDAIPEYLPTLEISNKEWYEDIDETPLFKRYIVSEEKATWDEAKLKCEMKGMRLANLDGKNELNTIEKYIINNGLLPKDVFSGYWVAGKRDLDLPNNWIWAYTKKNIDLYNFVPGEPNSYSEYCLELKNDLAYLGLNNYYCNDPRRYICEKIVKGQFEKQDDATYFDLEYSEAKELSENENISRGPETVPLKQNRFPLIYSFMKDFQPQLLQPYPPKTTVDKTFEIEASSLDEIEIPDERDSSNSSTEAPESSILLVEPEMPTQQKFVLPRYIPRL